MRRWVIATFINLLFLVLERNQQLCHNQLWSQSDRGRKLCFPVHKFQYMMILTYDFWVKNLYAVKLHNVLTSYGEKKKSQGQRSEISPSNCIGLTLISKINAAFLQVGWFWKTIPDFDWTAAEILRLLQSWVFPSASIGPLTSIPEIYKPVETLATVLCGVSDLCSTGTWDPLFWSKSLEKRQLGVFFHSWKIEPRPFLTREPCGLFSCPGLLEPENYAVVVYM